MGLLRRKPDPIAAEIDRLRAAVKAPPMSRVPGSHHVVFTGSKGGVGKTLTAAMLGHNLSELRGEVTVALDANPHMGTLRRRLIPASTSCIPAPFVMLAADAAAGHVQPEWSMLAAYADLAGRLRVVSNQAGDPTAVETMPGSDYTAAIALLRRAAQIVISDMGTSAVGEVAIAALDSADTLVVATELTQDSLELTIEMISALAGQPVSYRHDPADWSAVSDGRYAPLVRSAVVAVAPGRGDRDPADLAGLIDWLRAVCGGGVHLIPRDPHLALGDLIVPTALRPATAAAELAVAAAVASRFPGR